MLSYSLSWYGLTKGPEDGPNAYVCPLAIRLARGDRRALASIYLGSLFYRLDQCVDNIMRSIDRFYVVTHADTSCLQLFLWEQFKTLGPKQTQCDGIEMVEVKDNDGNMKIVPDRPLK